MIEEREHLVAGREVVHIGIARCDVFQIVTKSGRSCLQFPVRGARGVGDSMLRLILAFAFMPTIALAASIYSVVEVLETPPVQFVGTCSILSMLRMSTLLGCCACNSSPNCSCKARKSAGVGPVVPFQSSRKKTRPLIPVLSNTGQSSVRDSLSANTGNSPRLNIVFVPGLNGEFPPPEPERRSSSFRSGSRGPFLATTNQ